MNSQKPNNQQSNSNSNNSQRRCIYCGRMAPLVWVHGHGQCAACGINVDECCRGETYNAGQSDS